MTIAFYPWNDTPEQTKSRLLKRSQADLSRIMEDVRPIIADVKTRGDEALRHYAKKFEGCDLENIKATAEEFETAEKALEDDLKTAIQHCVRNVRRFHEEQMRRVEKPWLLEVEPGVFAGEQVSAIDSVGLYVPRGKGAFPSAMYMLCLPAVITGVKEIAVVTPPTNEGKADDASLYTAKLCGVENVYKVGGAQAIAALAYGTETLPRVRKVLGPGSPYVGAAKRLLSDVIDPGMPAGPSESIILADQTANPYNTCLDLLNETEHGKDSAALLITHDTMLAEYARENLPKLIDEMPDPQAGICRFVLSEEGYGGIILTDSLEQSIALANDYAAEHLHLKIKDAEKMRCALPATAEIITGEHATISLANYGTGVNHVLPTGGSAHTYSCTSIWDFLKRTSLSHVTKEGFDALKDSVTILAKYENFPAHVNAIVKRDV